MHPYVTESILEVTPPLHTLTSFNGSKRIPWRGRCFLTAGSSRVPATTRPTQDVSIALEDLLLTVEPKRKTAAYFLASVFCTRVSKHMLRQALPAWSPISPWSLGTQALFYSNGTRNEKGRKRHSPHVCLHMCHAWASVRHNRHDSRGTPQIRPTM